MPELSPAWSSWLQTQLSDLLGSTVDAADLIDRPQQDLFASGLNSLRAFTLLDNLADAGVDVDFVDLVQDATVELLIDRIADSGVPTPPA